mmetsp:Transcript_34777/g.40672  ORF Transcript_34777/g.40672 Transcript_34777/m.40672 type:complete len:80 (+) Transcript_34777:20-259(+)
MKTYLKPKTLLLRRGMKSFFLTLACSYQKRNPNYSYESILLAQSLEAPPYEPQFGALRLLLNHETASFRPQIPPRNSGT